VKYAAGWIALLALLGCGVSGRSADHAGPAERIVSMAPSLTEIVFELGLGDRMVGVTRYCDHPPAARELPTVGGYLDPSYERIVALQPDLVLLMQSHDEVARRLGELGIATLQTDQERLAGIIDSIRLVAMRCGVPARGAALTADLEARLARVRASVAGQDAVTTLVSVGRPAGRGPVTSVWAASGATFYSDALGVAGGVNVVEEIGVAYPEIGREGLLALDPDVILEVLPGHGPASAPRGVVLKEWTSLNGLRAVSSARVEVLIGDAYVRPGPRVVELVEAMAAALHASRGPGAGT
jgi:iron complex transport system substrate-binding protein